MGCDIHMYTEALLTIDDKTKWRSVDHYKINHYEDKYEVVELLGNRNYALFSALAGVRSSGFDVELLSVPKGMPLVVSKEVAKEYEHWRADAHSYSYCTLQELYDYQDKFSGKITYSGMVSPQDAVKIDNGSGTPEEWCKSTTIKDWVYREWTVNIDIFGELIKRLEARAKDVFWIFDKERVPEDKASKIPRLSPRHTFLLIFNNLYYISSGVKNVIRNILCLKKLKTLKHPSLLLTNCQKLGGGL